MSVKHRVLFVCLGNICRSPLAEGLFKRHAENHKVAHLFEVDSAGTNGLHIGEAPDPRTQRNAASHGLDLHHRGRKFFVLDFEDFDKIIVMDRNNLHTVLNLAQNADHESKVHMMRDWDPDFPGEEVPDPWYGGESGFEKVFQILNRSTEHLMHDLLKSN